MIQYIRNSDEKQRWLFASVLLNAILSVVKLAWGWMMGSTLVVADGIHSISDVFGALLIFLALFFATHKSQRFPYGLHKLEDMAALLGGIGILFAGYEIIRSVFFETGIVTPDEILGTIVFVIAIVIMQVIFYLFELKAANRLNSPGVKADAINRLGDIGAGIIVVTGLIAHHFHIAYAQEIAVIIIIFMLMKGAYEITKNGLFSLLDAADIELSTKVQNILMGYSNITAIKHLIIRKAGSVHFADIDVEMMETNSSKANRRVNEIADELRRQIDTLELANISYEPDHPPYQTTIRLLQEDKRHLSSHFGATVWLEIIHTDTSGTLISRTIIPNSAVDTSKGKAFKLVALLLELHADKVIIGKTTLDETMVALFDALDIEISCEFCIFRNHSPAH